MTPRCLPLHLGSALVCLAISLHGAAAQDSSALAIPAVRAPEEQFLQAVEVLEGGQIAAAIRELDRLVLEYPNFRMAHMVRGDLLLARAGGHAASVPARASSAHFAELRAEFQARVREHKGPPPWGLVPRSLWWLASGQQHAIVVDASRSRVYLFEGEGGTPRKVRDYYSAIGKLGIPKAREGDRKTPIGIYHVSSHIPGSRLPGLYGWGAFPISYPNEWDRRLGRTGNGIWIHGVPPENYARPPLSTDGCLALANPEIADLSKSVMPGTTPVVIAERVEWIAPDALRAESEQFRRHLEQWRRDWESRDTERYLTHYAQAFRSEGMDLAAWRAHKRRVNAGKSWIKVELRALSVLRDPGADPLVVVTFEQDYRSSNLSSRLRKRQYWVQEDGQWKIAHEEGVSRGANRLPDSFPDKMRYVRN